MLKVLQIFSMMDYTLMNFLSVHFNVFLDLLLESLPECCATRKCFHYCLLLWGSVIKENHS